MSNQELITTAYEAFNRRDIDVIIPLLSPDVDWPNGMEGGRLHGREQVRAYWMRQWEVLDPRVEPVRIKDDADGKTIVYVQQLVRDLDGQVLVDQIVQHVYSIREGLIERMEILSADGEAIEKD